MIKLIQGCKKMDRKAQREMVNHLSPFLYSISLRYAESHEDAKDLMQESLILIFNNIDKCSSTEEGPFRSWCRRIAINVALSKKRKKNFDNVPLNEIGLHAGVFPEINSQLNIEDVLNLLQYISLKERLVFNLFIIDGYSHKEIAEFLQIRESSSRTFLTRARKSLQHLIHQQEID